MFAKILVPVDRSSLAEQAIGQAASIARGANAAVDVVLVHQPSSFAGYLNPPANGEESTSEQEYVEAIAAQIKAGAAVTTTRAVVRGGPSEMICHRAREVGADLIVMTSHGRTGFSRTWLGSVADAVMRHAVIPVLMLRPERAGKTHRDVAAATIRRILVLLDGSALSADILPAATDLARATSATLTLLRVVPTVPVMLPYDAMMPVGVLPFVPDEAATQQLVEEATGQMGEIARQLRENADVSVEARVIVGRQVAESVVDFVALHGTDVVAMSTHGRGSSRLVWGSVADKVLRATRVPILLRRPAHVKVLRPGLGAPDQESRLPASESGIGVTS